MVQRINPHVTNLDQTRYGRGLYNFEESFLYIHFFALMATWFIYQFWRLNLAICPVISDVSCLWALGQKKGGVELQNLIQGSPQFTWYLVNVSTIAHYLDPIYVRALSILSVGRVYIGLPS